MKEVYIVIIKLARRSSYGSIYRQTQEHTREVEKDLLHHGIFFISLESFSLFSFFYLFLVPLLPVYSLSIGLSSKRLGNEYIKNVL